MPTAASCMEWRYAGCSIERFAGRVCQNTSARIMIPVSVPPMASQSSSTRGDGNQDGALRAASHPFVERLIGTVRREYLDRILFWTTADLETKLLDFQYYYNGHRTHAGLDGRPPEPSLDAGRSPASFRSYRWQQHCRGLYQTPIAA
jgi:hypothetical protein